MLEKSIALHVKLVKGEMRVSTVIMVLFGLGIALIPLGSMTVLIPMTVLSVCLIKGTVKLFGSSLYGSEGELYRMLPLSPMEILIGKALTMVLWQATLLTAFVLPLAAGLMVTDRLLTADFLERMVQDMLIQEMRPGQIGILAGLTFVGILVSEFAYCMFLILVQILLRKLVPQFAKKMSDFTGIIIAGIIYWGIIQGGDALAERVIPLGGAFYFVLIKYILILVMDFLLYRFCKENLEKGFE